MEPCRIDLISLPHDTTLQICGDSSHIPLESSPSYTSADPSAVSPTGLSLPHQLELPRDAPAIRSLFETEDGASVHAEMQLRRQHQRRWLTTNRGNRADHVRVVQTKINFDFPFYSFSTLGQQYQTQS